MNRRMLLQATSSAAIAVTFGGIILPKTMFAQGNITPSPIIETVAGKVRGHSESGIHSFLGIPYGEPTGGENRFKPARPKAPWTGIFEANEFGDRAPQIDISMPDSPSGRLWRFATNTMSEDCLVLNVWTPATDNKKRPVLFWCHGGGFFSGSGHEPDYHGANLARNNDVVVVTVNHRLNALGYCYLGDSMGEEYSDSGNVGMLDLVLALEWVRDNISQFGGEPGNVTIYGQSGGGSKVSTLLAMPAAEGLFHKAVIMSGPGVEMSEIEDAERDTSELLGKLNLSKNEISKLQTVPAKDLVASSFTRPSLTARTTRRGFGPVVDGRSLPAHPFNPSAPTVSKSVPIMIGYTEFESTTFLMNDPKFGSLNEDELLERVQLMVEPSHAESLIKGYRDLYPEDSPTYVLSRLVTDHRFLLGSFTIADRKFEQGSAPVYSYVVTWETPILDGILRSPHGVDMALFFDNVEVARDGLLGPGPEPQQLSDMLSKSLTSFAKSGDPNNAGIPQWFAYDPEDRSTMIFDVPSHAKEDPFQAQRNLWETYPPL